MGPSDAFVDILCLHSLSPIFGLSGVKNAAGSIGTTVESLATQAVDVKPTLKKAKRRRADLLKGRIVAYS